MRFLAFFLLALSFATSSSAKIVIGSKPPVWPASYTTDYTSTYSPVAEFPSNGFIGVSNNEKIRADSHGEHYSIQSITVKNGSDTDADVYYTKQFGRHPSECDHWKRPFNRFLSNPDNHCLEFEHKGEGLFHGVSVEGWSTVCSISSKDLVHHPNRGTEGEENVRIAMTYYYHKSVPLAVISSPLSGPAVNINATIIYSNFQSVDPDATLFAPPTTCAEKEGRRWGGRGFGGGIYRDDGIPRHHPEDLDESGMQGKHEGVIRSLIDRKIRFKPHHDNEYNGKNDQEIIHRPRRPFSLRRHPAGHPMGEMEDKPGMGMGMGMGRGMGGHMGGGGMDGHMGGGGDMDHMKDFRSKLLTAHVTRTALHLIHFVNAKYLQKQN